MTRRLALLAAAGLSGCISLLPDSGPPPDIHRLTAPALALPADAKAQDWVIEIAAPTASKAIASDRLTLVTPDQGLAYVAGARWASDTPRLIQDLLVETLDSSGLVRAAARPSDGVRARFELRADISAFEVEQPAPGEAPTAHVRLRVKLVDVNSRELIAARAFDERVLAGSARVGAIVAALNTAAETAARAIAVWSVDEGRLYAEARAAAPPAPPGPGAAEPAAQPAPALKGGALGAQPSESAASTSR